MRKTTEEKFVENAEKTIKRNIRSGSTLQYAWNGDENYRYIMIRNYGIIRTTHELPEYLMYDHKKEDATQNVEILFNNVLDHLNNDDDNRRINRLTINRTQLKSRISTAKNGKHYAQVEIILGECVVNAEYLLEIMTACNTNDIYLIKIQKPKSKSTMTVPYILDSLEKPETEAILLPIVGRDTAGKHLFDTYLCEGERA